MKHRPDVPPVLSRTPRDWAVAVRVRLARAARFGWLLGVAWGCAAWSVRAETLRVGVETNSAPLSFLDSNGRPSGFSVDIVAAVARDQGLDVQFVVMPWKDQLTQIRSGRLDMMANMSYSEERTTFVDFTVADLQLPAGVFYNANLPHPPTSAAELAALRTGTGRQSLGEGYLQRHGGMANIHYYDTLQKDVEAVDRGEVDATIASGPVTAQMVHDLGLKNVRRAKFVPDDLVFESHMAVPIGRTILLYKLNTGLAHIHANGTYDKLYERWVGPLEARDVRWRDVQGLVLVSVLIVGILLAAFLWQRRVSTRLYTQAENLRRIEGELRESQSLLNRSAQLLQQTQSAARIGGWELETATGQLFWTEESYRLHEVEPGQFHPTFEALLSLYTPESRPTLKSALETTFSAGVPCDLEVELVTRTQRRVQVHVTGRAERGPNGRVVRSYGSFHDVTASKRSAEERDRLQLKMLETQKLESLGVLAGGIAHDFNNILTVILSNAHLARMMTHTSPDLDDHLKQISDASQRAAELCQRMLAYAGKGKLVLERVDLSALVTDSSPLLEHLVSKKAKLVFDVSDQLPGIDADAAQIHQVLLNLTVNASEALQGQEGTVRVTTGATILDAGDIARLAPHSEAPEGLFVFLKVTDTGCGMSSETLSKIFDPFYTTKFTGRGLGLAAVHGIIRGHRGVLRVESELGKGTTFQLYLPAIDGTPVAPAKAAAARRPSPVPGPERLVLLAEDEPTVRRALVAMLRRAGFTAVSAEDGREALDLYQADPKRFAAVVLDLTMPRLDGAEALREMRLINPGVKALIMSGFGEEETLAKLHESGRAVFLHKPFTPDEFSDRLATAMS